MLCTCLKSTGLADDGMLVLQFSGDAGGDIFSKKKKKKQLVQCLFKSRLNPQCSQEIKGRPHVGRYMLHPAPSQKSCIQRILTSWMLLPFSCYIYSSLTDLVHAIDKQYLVILFIDRRPLYGSQYCLVGTSIFYLLLYTKLGGIFSFFHSDEASSIAMVPMRRLILLPRARHWDGLIGLTGTGLIGCWDGTSPEEPYSCRKNFCFWLSSSRRLSKSGAW